MTDSNASDNRLDQILADFLAAQAKGESPSPEKLMRDNPEFTGDIQAFLSNQNLFKFDKSTNVFTPIDPKKSPRIGNFKLLQRLGEGGMGEVWMADQEKPVRRRVAIKLIKPGMDSRAVLARFDAERQALALMNHPNIAKVFEAGIVGEEDQGVGAGRPYFVMELVKGIPVTEFCDQRRLPIRERLDLFRQSCSAVHHAHQKGIIHRDLKPSNILVESHDDRPVLKIIDFGLAKAIGGSQLTEQTLFTALGAIAGTPLYMAPEQAVLNAIDIDIRADVYSLGVLLYELLTGTTPLTKDSMHKKGIDELMKLIREFEAPKPSLRLSVSESLPSIAAMRQAEPQKLGRFMRGELDWIVMKALAKERERRYGSAMALSEDILRFLSEEPVQASPPSTLYALQKFAKRHRGIVIAASAVTGALGLGMVGTTIGFMRAQQTASLERLARQESVEARDAAIVAREQAELEAYVANIALTQAAIENNDFEAAKRKLDACPEHMRGFEWEFLKRQTSCVIGVLPESVERYEGGEIFPYKFSSDESLVLVHVDKNAVQVFRLNGVAESAEMKHPNLVLDSSFNADATKVATLCADGNIRIWDVSNLVKAPEVIFTQRATQMESSPKLSRLVIVDNSDISVLDFNGRVYGGEPTRGEFMKMDHNRETFITRSPDGSYHWFDLKDARLIHSETQDSLKNSSISVNFARSSGRFCTFYRRQGQDGKQITKLVGRNGKTYGEFQGSLTILHEDRYAIERSLETKDSMQDTIWDLRDGEQRLVRTQVTDTSKISGGFAWEPGVSGLWTENQLVTYTQPRKVGSSHVLRLWDERGQKVKESSLFLRGNSSSMYYTCDPLALGDQSARIIFDTFPQHLQIADSRTLEFKSFPFSASISEADNEGPREQINFPALFSSNYDFSASRSRGACLWSNDGVRLGEYTRELRTMTQLKNSKVGVLGSIVVGLDALDNGISQLDSSIATKFEAEAILESCSANQSTKSAESVGQLTVTTKPQKVIIENQGVIVAQITTASSAPVAIACAPQQRIFIADGRNIRIFSSKSLREVASFRQVEPIRNLQASIDGRCIIVSLANGTAVAWDIRPFEEKLAFWKACADELKPAMEFFDSLMRSDAPSNQLVEKVASAESLTARRRWGIMRFVETSKVLDEDLSTTLFNSLLIQCVFSKPKMLAELSALDTSDPNWRKVEYARKRVNAWTPEQEAGSIKSYCDERVYSNKLPRSEYENSLSASLLLIDDKDNRNKALFWCAASHYRLGNYEDTLENILRIPGEAQDYRGSRGVLRAMTQWNLGDQESALRYITEFPLPENATDDLKKLYDEAKSLIQSK